MNKKDKNRWMHDKQWMYDSRFVKLDGSRGKKLQLVDLYLTQTDFFDFLKSYNISEMHFVDCYAFTAKRGVFTNYIDYWYNLKKTCTGGRKRVAKIMLNSLSGSMARRVDYVNGIIVFDERGMATVKYAQTKSRNPKCYVHIGAAITSYARHYILQAIDANYDNWLYTDTDSLHIQGNPDGIKISDEIGDYKTEKQMQEVVYYKLKEYGYKDNNGYHLTLAGCEHRDVQNIENYINHRSHTLDTWVTGKYAKEWKQYFVSDNPLMDLFYQQIPMTSKIRQGWFNTGLATTWHTYQDDTLIVKKDPVKIKTHYTTVQAMRDHDAKLQAWYRKQPHAEIVPYDEWLIKVHKCEIEAAAEKKRKFEAQKGGFTDIRDEDIPFKDIQNG